MTDCERLLDVLMDGRPHTHHELYQLGMVVHSRVSDLRKKGHEIRAWRTREWNVGRQRESFTYFYRLVPAALPEPSSAASTGDGGSGSAALSGSCMTTLVEGASSVGGSAPSAPEPVQLSFGEAMVAGRPAWA